MSEVAAGNHDHGMRQIEAAVLKRLCDVRGTSSYWLYRSMGFYDRKPAKKGYPILRKMLRRGLIEGDGGGVKTYFYKITEAGRLALAKQSDPA